MPLLDRTQVPRDVKALGMAPIGKYAVSVDWSDGHKSLYPFKQIAALAERLRGEAASAAGNGTKIDI